MRSLLTLSAALLFGGVLLAGCDSGYGLDDDDDRHEPRTPPKKYVTPADAPAETAAVRLDASGWS